ncbi:hypothetical protein POTOM_030578 [Populus tomentosa]|uniref:Dienelactone hydrolase domain-containing protein n=1 Tax=Populus tomentosa TaxID=118781 RepID=A0A8X8CU91_POPTO|nr:hypothetical protein POTOM_030578 [Populus tomentosa]
MAGPQCCAHPPTLNPSSGAGHVEKVGGLDSYVSGSPDSKLAILLVSDVYGYEAPNLRGVYTLRGVLRKEAFRFVVISLFRMVILWKLADKIAAAGFYAVVPDFFYGDPFARDNAERPIQVWLKDHGARKGFEDAKPVIEALNTKGVSAVGAVGFCWGGRTSFSYVKTVIYEWSSLIWYYDFFSAKVVVELGKSSAFIKAAVLCHPSFVTVDDFKEFKVPISILGAEIDQMSPPALLKQFEEVLASKSEVDSFVKIFPKVAHGWTVRYDVEDEAAVKSAEEAHGNLMEWFAKYVK